MIKFIQRKIKQQIYNNNHHQFHRPHPPKIFLIPFSTSDAAFAAALPVSCRTSPAPLPASEKMLDAKEAGTSTIPDATLPAVSAVLAAKSPAFEKRLVKKSPWSGST